MAKRRSGLESLADTVEGEENKFRRKRKKKRNENSFSLASNTFQEIYILHSEVLGQGAYAIVQSCVNRMTSMEYAVKIIEKGIGYSRVRVLREIELNYKCQGHRNIIQLVEFFEEEDRFYLVFEKGCGGQLTHHLAIKGPFSEDDAATVIREIASALVFLHKRGVAHRDLKPENILCSDPTKMFPVKICDFDLGSAGDLISQCRSSTTPVLTSPVGSAEFMAPEIVGAFVDDTERCVRYDKKCDIWSLGVLLYILLSGSAPFQGDCGKKCGWDKGEPCEECMVLLFRNIYRGSYSLDTDMWKHVSGEAKDLIIKLLVIDSKSRMSAENILEHPWLTKYKHFPSTKTDEDIPGLSQETEETVKTVSVQHLGSAVVQPFLQLSSPEESRMIRRRKALKRNGIQKQSVNVDRNN